MRFHRRYWFVGYFVICNVELHPSVAFECGYLGDLTSWIFLRMVYGLRLVGYQDIFGRIFSAIVSTLKRQHFVESETRPYNFASFTTLTEILPRRNCSSGVTRLLTMMYLHCFWGRKFDSVSQGPVLNTVYTQPAAWLFFFLLMATMSLGRKGQSR